MLLISIFKEVILRKRNALTLNSYKLTLIYRIQFLIQTIVYSPVKFCRID